MHFSFEKTHKISRHLIFQIIFKNEIPLKIFLVIVFSAFCYSLNYTIVTLLLIP